MQRMKFGMVGIFCEAFGVERCNTIEEICEKSDVLFILAPTNPEKHLEYAKTALKYGKRTYIDKTFAPDAAKAFAMAPQIRPPAPVTTTTLPLKSTLRGSFIIFISPLKNN